MADGRRVTLAYLFRNGMFAGGDSEAGHNAAAGIT